MDDLAALAENIPTEVLDYVDEVESSRDEALAKVAELQKALDKHSGDGSASDDENDPIAKALSDADPELVQLFKSQSERLEAAESALDTLQEREANAQWVAKARSFDGLIDPEEFGPQLRAVAETSPETAEAIASALETAASQVAKSALFTEIGGVAPLVESEAKDEATRLAKSLREANPSLSEEEARAKVWESNPDLYDQYITEQREAVRGL